MHHSGLVVAGVTAGLLLCACSPGPSARAPLDPLPAAPDSTVSTMAITAGVPPHFMTGDYFGSPWGTTTVSAASAKPYLTYVRTAASNGTALHAAGLRVQVYTNPNRLETQDPLYKETAPGSVSKTCSSANVYDTFAGLTQYVGTPYNASLQGAYAALVKSQAAQGSIDQIFMDNTGALSDFGVPFFPAMPCGYTDSLWISAEKELADASSIPIVFNGLSALHNQGVSLGIGVLGAARVVGGELEHCFSDDHNAEQGSWPWTAAENTQLQVAALHKQFHCQAVNTAEADASYPARIYTLASFLMTYDPNYSVLWEEFGTPSGLHVMPESAFVALDAQIHPTDVSELKQPSGSYVRIYNACYYRGSSVGTCAMAVNPDYSSHPVSLAGFHHTLALSGNGVLDGGTLSAYGAAPPSVLGATSAVVALP